MKEKFLHNDFFNYMRLMNKGVNATLNNQKYATHIFLTILSVIVIMLVQFSLCASESGIAMAPGGSLGIYICCLICGVARNIKPSAFNLQPISYKKRSVFSYLASLAYLILAILVFAAFILMYMLIIGLVVLMFTGEWIFVIEETAAEEAAAGPTASVLGSLFLFFNFFLMFGAGMIISYIKNSKMRVAAMFILPAALEVIALLMVNFCAPGSDFRIAYDVINNFEKLPLSWLWLTVYAIISAAVFAFSVYFVIKNEKPKEF